MRARRLVTVAALALSAACDRNPAQPTYDPPAVAVSVDPTFLGPRDGGTITMTVTPVRADPVQSGWLLLDAGPGARDSIAFPLDGSTNEQSAVLSLSIPVEPISATILVIGRATSRSRRVAEDTARFVVGDTTPPQVRWVVSDTAVHAGQTTSAAAAYADHSGLLRQELHLRGAVTRDESYDPPDHDQSGSIAFQFSVPNTPGDSIVQTAIATDIYGLKTQIRQVWHILP